MNKIGKVTCVTYLNIFVVLLGLLCTGCLSSSWLIHDAATVHYESDDAPVTVQVYPVVTDTYPVRMSHLVCVFTNTTKNNYKIDWSQSTIQYNSTTCYLFDADDVSSKMRLPNFTFDAKSPVSHTPILREATVTKNLIAGDQVEYHITSKLVEVEPPHHHHHNPPPHKPYHHDRHHRHSFIWNSDTNMHISTLSYGPGHKPGPKPGPHPKPEPKPRPHPHPKPHHDRHHHPVPPPPQHHHHVYVREYSSYYSIVGIATRTVQLTFCIKDDNNKTYFVTAHVAVPTKDALDAKIDNNMNISLYD